jgi:hypothetical protein
MDEQSFSFPIRFRFFAWNRRFLRLPYPGWNLGPNDHAKASGRPRIGAGQNAAGLGRAIIGVGQAANALKQHGFPGLFLPSPPAR